ncbi:MAG: CapA family protein, partial [Candidatus Dormibacteraeota bacterium]|nr:CapA family protein [Candidatus Dormibacteraeota bacterium]
MRLPRRRRRFGPLEAGVGLVGLALLVTAIVALASGPTGRRTSALVSPRPTTRAPASASPGRPADSPSPSPANSLLSINSIFGKPADLSRIPASRRVSLVVTGDIIPARHTNEQMLQRGNFRWPFEPTADYLHTGDIEFINLEAPLFATCKPSSTGMSFCGDPRFIDGLAYAGINVANLSNNHLTNFGPTGTNSTEKLLTDHQIQPTGLGLLAKMTVKGVRFAFLGFNGVGTAVPRAEMQREIAAARPTADVLVVQFHWGREYVLTPQSTGDSIAPDDPREIGHLAIDDGADLVIGNHPHAVQGVEIYRDKL